jgi:hypothetical protein
VGDQREALCDENTAEFENVMRPFVEANQALGRKSAKIMRSGERKSFPGWLLKQLMRIMLGPVTEWLINRGTERIRRAANAICLKDYSSFLRSKKHRHDDRVCFCDPQSHSFG